MKESYFMAGIDVYMVRHGQTYFNLLRRFQGFSDAPLTDAGIQDGHKAGQRLAKIHFDGAYSSDLTRAIHTARYALSENQAQSPVEPTTLPNFREENFGSFEGRDSQVTLTDLNARVPKAYNAYADMVEDLGMPVVMDIFHDADPYHLAESYQEFVNRIEAGFKDLKSRHQDGDKVLLVSHGTTIRAIADYFGHPEMAAHSVHNGAVMHLRLKDDGADILAFNDITTVFD